MLGDDNWQGGPKILWLPELTTENPTRYFAFCDEIERNLRIEEKQLDLRVPFVCDQTRTSYQTMTLQGTPASC